jgi:hypothetical protein
MASFGKRDAPPTTAFREAPITNLARPPAAVASPRSLEVSSIGTAKTIKAALIYFAVFFALLATASVLLLAEHPASLAASCIAFFTHLFERA